ncbi:MAG: acyltransferase [Rhodobacteraceae bacterium]|nr:acyltransferase [Paracoccaceae bacterium]
MRYRRHIDGLRTVAILPVVAFHLELSPFHGGFTGVDVFFVISGFLITSMIVDELRQGRFSLMEFYKRRALRILPAYVAMIAAVVIAAYFLMLPGEARSLGLTVAAASAFLSNVYFWRVTDYFNPNTASEPLIHTWTLSVEEQFYILLPILLVLVARFLWGRFGPAVILIGLLSFGLSIVGLRLDATGTFYLLPTRAWEFGLGALAAIYALETRVTSPNLRAAGALLGVALIGYGVFGLGPESVFPGPNALFPVLGAVLLIVCAEGTAVGTVLSTKGFVGIGKISYSLYLWHWPIIVFYRIAFGPVLGPGDVVLLLVLSFAVTVLSYVYIEQPFRTPGMRRRRAARVVATAGGTLAATIALGLVVFQMSDRWGAYGPEVRRIAAYADYRLHNPVHPCMVHARLPGQFEAFDPARCLPAPDGDGPAWLLVGDSHAEHLMAAFEQQFPGATIQSAGASGCRPLTRQQGDWFCPQLMRLALDSHVPEGGLDGVILSGRWVEGDLDRLRETVTFLEPYVDRVVLLGPTVEYLDSFPKLLARGAIHGNTDMSRFLDPDAAALDARMRAIPWGPKTQYVSMIDLICDDGCPLFADGDVPFHADYGHYTGAAAVDVARRLDVAGLIAPR